MFHPLHKLFRQQKLSWGETDVKFFIERYLRQHVKTDQLYCEGVSQGLVTIRAGSPAIHQEVVLLEYNLQRELQQKAQYVLQKLRVYNN